LDVFEESLLKTQLTLEMVVQTVTWCTVGIQLTCDHREPPPYCNRQQLKQRLWLEADGRSERHSCPQKTGISATRRWEVVVKTSSTKRFSRHTLIADTAA